MQRTYFAPVWLQPLDEGLHGDLHGVRPAVAPRRALPVLHPPLRREVGRLGDVEARIKAGVVTKREGYHNFALFLHNLLKN